MGDRSRAGGRTLVQGIARRFRGRTCMIKRTLLFLLLWSISSIGALGQQICTNRSTKLACQIPVVTRAAYLGTIGNPAAAFSSSFATQLGQLPLLSSGSGVVLTLDKTLGVYVASENLGPILTDRAQTIGKHKLLLAFAYQKFLFNSIDGTGFGSVPFVFAAGSVPPSNPRQPCTSTGSLICLQQNDNISMNVNQYFISSTGTAQGPALPFTSYAPGSASGIGDVLINVKRLIWSGEKTHFAAGLLLRFPTGDALNYLGSGAYGFDPYAVLAYQAGRVSPHVRLGYQFNTSTVLNPTINQTTGAFTGSNSNLPGGLQYDFGADAVLFKKIPTTVAGDFLGNYIVNAPVLVPSTVTVPGYDVPPQNTLIPKVSSYNSAQLSIGLKVKPWKNLILYGNVLIQLNDVGLRSRPVPLVGISYTFF